MDESGLQSCLVVGFQEDRDSKGNMLKKKQSKHLTMIMKSDVKLGYKQYFWKLNYAIFELQETLEDKQYETLIF